MDKYILEMYQDQRNKDPKFVKGFNRFSFREKIIVYCCLGIMFIAAIGTIAALIIYPEQFWYLIGLAFCVVALLFLFLLDGRERKKHIDKYVDSYKHEIDILYDILCNKFNANSKEKIEQVIQLYEKDLEQKNQKEKNRNKIIYGFFSVLAGTASISFANLNVIGIDFRTWLQLAAMILMFIWVAGVYIYFISGFDTTKEDYQMMIKELKTVLIMKL